MNGPQVWSGRNVRALIVAGVALAAASCSSSDDGATISAGTETVQTTVATTTDATATTSTTASTAPTVSIASLATPLQLVVIGDSTSNADTCPGCQGYVDQYATELESRINRPVNTTRIDASVLPDAESAVTSDVTARDQVAAADVVIVAVGFNNVLPDPEYTVRIATAAGRPPEELGCVGDLGNGMEGIVAWLLNNTPECEQAQIDAAAAAYDTVFGAIGNLRHGAPTALLALNVYDANYGGPDWQGIDVPASTMDEVNQWILDA